MTYTDARTAIIQVGILALAGAILYTTKRLAEWRAAHKRSEEARQAFLRGIWYE